MIPHRFNILKKCHCLIFYFINLGAFHLKYRQNDRRKHDVLCDSARDYNYDGITVKKTKKKSINV